MLQMAKNVLAQEVRSLAVGGAAKKKSSARKAVVVVAKHWLEMSLPGGGGATRKSKLVPTGVVPVQSITAADEACAGIQNRSSSPNTKRLRLSMRRFLP